VEGSLRRYWPLTVSTADQVIASPPSADVAISDLLSLAGPARLIGRCDLSEIASSLLRNAPRNDFIERLLRCREGTYGPFR
jgi:hypothetical protein